MYMMGLLTATEKQIQWTNSPRSVPYETNVVTFGKSLEELESLEKLILIPESLHPHLKWCLKEANVFQGQPLPPPCHAVQIFTAA